VLSGAAVRLTGSGLGCPDWAEVLWQRLSAADYARVIEFSNRLITVPVSIAAGAACCWRCVGVPYRRDMMWSARCCRSA